MKTLVNKNNPAIRITAPSSEIKFVPEGKKFRSHWKIGGYILRADDWTLVEEESKHTEVWVEGRTIFEQDAKKPEENPKKGCPTYPLSVLGDLLAKTPQAPIRFEQEQKPVEWSEEDEDNLCRVIRVLEDNDSDWEELSNWLKSLKPQPKQDWIKEQTKK